MIKDWALVESERGFNTPSKTPISTGSSTPRKRVRMQSESPTPTSMSISSKEPETLDKFETKEGDGDVFNVISVSIHSLMAG